MQDAYKRQHPCQTLPIVVNADDHAKFTRLCVRYGVKPADMFHQLICNA